MTALAVLTFVRTYWKLAALGVVAMLLAVQTVRLGHRTNQLEKERINSNELRFELDRISSRKNEQKRETVNRIDGAERGEREAQPIADNIREAPIPPNCATPGIEILRNEI